MTSRLTGRDNLFRLAALDRRSDKGCGVGIDHGNTGERDCQTRRFVQRKNEKASGAAAGRMHYPQRRSRKDRLCGCRLIGRSRTLTICWAETQVCRVRLRSALDGQWHVEPSYDGGRRRTWRWRWGICRRGRRCRRVGCCWRLCWRISGRWCLCRRVGGRWRACRRVGGRRGWR